MNIKLKMLSTLGKTGLKIKANSAEILMVTGVVGFMGTVITASTATLKVEEVLDEHTAKIDNVKEVLENLPEKYNEQDAKKDTVIIYTQTAVKIVKLYLPAITLGVVSLSAFLAAHKIIKARNFAITAAYKAIESSFNKYRKRVVDTYGEDVDKDFKYGIRREKITVIEEDPETGKKKKVKKEVEIVDPDGISDYNVIFNDQTSEMWSRVPGGNTLFLKYQQEHANNTLHTRGHVFLNEVYGWLGMEHTPAGAVVGWVENNGDDFIDFGVIELNDYDDIKDSYKKGNNLVLDFNVDGIVYDLI